MSQTHKSIAVRTLVAGSVVVAALAAWELRVVLALVVVALMLAAGMRPGVDALAARGIPRAIGVLAHFAALASIVALVAYFVLPPLLHQASQALAAAHASEGAGPAQAVREQAVEALGRWINESDSLQQLVHPAVAASKRALEILGGVFFVLAFSAYLTLDYARVRRYVLVRLLRADDAGFETWNRAEAKLGRYVRGQLLLVTFAATVLSVAFRAIGLPYWLMLGVFSGVVELIPVVGPLVAGVVSVGVALTVSVHAAALAAAAVYGLRLLQDYVLVPRVIGRAVELPPLATLVLVAVVGVAVGPAIVPIATPLAAVLFVVAEHRFGRDA